MTLYVINPSSSQHVTQGIDRAVDPLRGWDHPIRCLTLDWMIEIGCLLRDECRADVLILGCAGTADYRDPIENATGMPVIEPCQAAVALALGRITLRLTHGETKHA